MEAPILNIILGSLVIVVPIIALNIFQRKKQAKKRDNESDNYSPPSRKYKPHDYHYDNPWRT